MKPRSYQSELPGTAVTASPIQPPVHDSALASMARFCLRASPTRSANRYSSESKWISQRPHQHHRSGQAEQSEEGRGDIVHHDAEAAVKARLDDADRPRLERIEQAEQDEGDALPRQGARREEEHEQERDDLVPYDRLVVLYAQIAPGTPAHP